MPAAGSGEGPGKFGGASLEQPPIVPPRTPEVAQRAITTGAVEQARNALALTCLNIVAGAATALSAPFGPTDLEQISSTFSCFDSTTRNTKIQQEHTQRSKARSRQWDGGHPQLLAPMLHD